MVSSSSSNLVVVGETCVLVTTNESVVHGLIAGAFSLEARQWHQFPLLDEKVSPIFTSEADLLKLVSHKFALRITDAL